MLFPWTITASPKILGGVLTINNTSNFMAVNLLICVAVLKIEAGEAMMRSYKGIDSFEDLINMIPLLIMNVF